MNYNFDNEKFRALIYELGYKSEKKFFEQTHTPKSTFQNIKNGSCSLSTVTRLCEILKCDITDLFPSDRLVSMKNKSYVSKVKKISILSAASGVGVTTFSVHLAQMLERRRFKTLIVEVGDSSSFDILDLQNKRTKLMPTIIGDTSIKIKRHGDWLDSLRLIDLKEETSFVLNDGSVVNFELTNLKLIFEELVKMNHYDYIIFSCRNFPFQTLIEKGENSIHGQDQLLKLADIALVGLDTSRIEIEKAKLMITWLLKLKIEIFITEFMRAKKNSFKVTRHENNEEIVFFDKRLYGKYIRDQKKYFKILNDVVSQNNNVHMAKQFLSYSGDMSLETLNKSVFLNEDLKLKKAVRKYKYQVKNLFEEIDSFEREVYPTGLVEQGS